MKKVEGRHENDDLRTEYDRSVLGKGIRGKHLKHFRAGTNLARLAPYVREAFPDDASVDRALRSVMRKHPA